MNPFHRGQRSPLFVNLLITVCIPAALCACGSRATEPPAVTPRPLGASLPAYRPVGDSARSVVPAMPAMPAGDSVTLQSAISFTLLHSPDLAAFAWETRAREARALQAGRLPNPTFELLAEDIGAKGLSSGDQSVSSVQRQTTLQLSQLIELGGERGSRRQLASRERDLAEWDYEAARVNALTGVTHAFIDVLVAQQLVSLARQTDELVGQVEQSVGARVVAGVVSPIEETRAQVARATARVDLDQAERLLAASRARLAASWGQPTATFRGAAGTLETVGEIPPLERLQERIQQNPDLARWATEISARQSSLAYERARSIPDLQIVGGYRRFNDLNVSAYVIGASIPIPLFDRNRDAVSAAHSLVNKAVEEQRAAAARVAAALAGAYRTMSGARNEVIALRETVLPRSRETFELMTEGYRLGKFGYLDVLDAQRTLIANGERYLRALSDFHKSVADVERLIGAPLTDTTSR
jgi:outer membrane protein, heavy metal efflux system